MPISLIVAAPRRQETRVAMADGRACVVGRAADCDIVVDDQRVSSRHATIEGVDGGFRVVDRGSRNGTFVNGKAIAAGESVALKIGDEIRLGESVLRVAAPSADDMPTATGAGDENTRPVAALGRAVGAAAKASPADAREFARRAEQLRAALDARIAAGAGDPVGHLLPARLKDFLSLFAPDDRPTEFSEALADELRPALATAFPPGDARPVHALVADLAGVLVDALAGRATNDDAVGRIVEFHAPTLLAHDFFNDSLRRQALELMGAILVRRGHLADDAAMRAALGRIDLEAPLSASALLDMQTCRLRGCDPQLAPEEPGPPRDDLATAVLHWSATSSFCRYLFKRWNWLPNHEPNFSMPARSNEIEEVRDNSRGLYEEWKDGLAPQGLATLSRDGATDRHGFADMAAAIVGVAGSGGTALLRATREELGRERGAVGGLRLRPEGDARFVVGDDAVPAERRPAIAVREVAADGLARAEELPPEVVAARGLLFVVDDRCFAVGRGERPRVDPGAVAAEFAAVLRKYRERNPRVHHVPVGLVVNKIDAILGEEIRALARPYLIPSNASLSVLQAGISARNLPTTPYERLWTSVVEDLALNRHPRVQRFVRSLLWHFKPFVTELMDFTYRYQFFVAASEPARVGVAEPMRWMAAKLYGPHLRQARLALVAESQDLEATAAKLRGRLESLAPMAERLRGLRARVREAEAEAARKVLPMPGARGRVEAVARQADDAETELLAVLARAEREADVPAAAETAPWQDRLARLAERVDAIAARRAELDAWAEQTREAYSAFHPVGMTTLYWS